MRVAVIGAGGFVGSRVVAELEGSGCDVRAVKAPRIRTDVVELDGYSSVVDDLARQIEDVDVVINAAGVPDASSRDDDLLIGGNAVMPALVARAAALMETRPRLVHVSSAVVQGRRSELDATMETDAFSGYARSKAIGEQLVRQELPDRHVIYRPPSVHAEDRRVTRTIVALAGSPLRSVAGRGDAPSPQALAENVASAIAFLATSEQPVPPVVIHPWEGVTTGSLMRSLGGREPHHLPERLTRGILALARVASRVVPALAADVRRVEMMWSGQRQAPSWLTSAGWQPRVGHERWASLRTSVVAQHAESGSPGVALVATTIPMTLRHFYGEMIELLRGDGYEVQIVSSSGPHLDAAQRETGATAFIIEMSRKVSPLQDLGAWLRWNFLIARRRPALVIAGTPKCALLAMTAGALWRVPRRVYLCGGLRLEGASGPLRWLLLWMERFAMGAATEVMVNSATLRTEVLAATLVHPAKLRQTVPGSTHGVNSQQFRPRTADVALRQSLSIEPGVPVLGFVGRLTHDKGIDTLLEAGRLLQQQGRLFHLLVVGPQNEPDSREYVSRLEACGFPVSLVGPQEDVRPYYALLSLHVLPSLREGFPNVVLEASAMGIPTVTTTATGCRDAVIDGTTGLQCFPNDSPALACAIAKLLDNEDLRDRMGRQAREWVVSEFDPKLIVSQWLHAPLTPRGPRTLLGRRT